MDRPVRIMRGKVSPTVEVLTPEIAAVVEVLTPEIQPIAESTAVEVMTTRAPKRVGRDSADKDTPRETKGNRASKITFVGGVGEKAISNKRKRIHLNAGGMVFNERDKRILLLVAALSYLDKNQLANLLGNTGTAASLRPVIKRLVTHGLLAAKFTGIQNQTLYTSTALGLKLSGCEGFRVGASPSMQTYEHTNAITAVAANFINHARDGVCFMTEMELMAAVASGKLSPRILAHGFTKAYIDTNIKDWVPTSMSEHGNTVITKRPDGYLLKFTDNKALLPIPVEVERTFKNRGVDSYRDTLLTLAGAANAGKIAHRVIYYAPMATGVYEKVRTALASVYKASPNFEWPSLLPKVIYEVHDLDPIFTPFSANAKWVRGKRTNY
jgi:hypothetical protein